MFGVFVGNAGSFRFRLGFKADKSCHCQAAQGGEQTHLLATQISSPRLSRETSLGFVCWVCFISVRCWVCFISVRCERMISSSERVISQPQPTHPPIYTLTPTSLHALSLDSPTLACSPALSPLCQPPHHHFIIFISSPPALSLHFSPL
jgi:hypothetical protein